MKDVLRSRWGWGWVLAASMVLALPAAAQFAETTDVVVVEVPVQVLGKDGNPVRGLTAADFEVSEGRKKLPITGFEVLDLEVAPTDMAASEMPTSARRHFLMLFDLSFAEPKSIIKARQAAADVVDSLHPTDLVAVATYAQSTGPQLVLGFTPDRRQAKLALDTLGLPQLVDRTPDPLRMVMSEAKEAMQKAPGAESGKRVDMSEQVLEHLEGLYRESDRANQVVAQNKVKALTRSFTDLARLMAGIQGRKHVVYLSEGFDSTLLSGTVETEEQDDMAAAAASGEIWTVDSDKRFGNTSAINVVEQMLESFRRSDCAIQAVDIGGLRDSGDIQGKNVRGKDSLIQMARGTGGEIYENFNDLSTAMDKMLQRTSVTYVLAVQPENVKFDGAYHKLKVELKNGNGRVVHRPGYYAPRPAAQQNPMERLFATASQVMGGEDSGPIATAVMAAPFHQAGSSTAYVPVVIEVDGRGLLAGKQGNTLPAEVFIYAMDQTGSVQDYLTQTLGLDLSKVQGALQQSGMKFFGHLDLPPGRYSVRVLVRNGTTGAHGLRVLPLEVPTFADAEPVLLPPFFPEPMGKWLMVREQPRGQQKDVPYPFMLKDQPYIPASMPVLGPGQEAQVSLVGYNLGAGDVQVRTQVLGADGKEVAPGELKVLGREGGSPQRMMATFKAPNLQPGEYTLRVILSTGGEPETSSARFVVKSGAAAARSGG